MWRIIRRIPRFKDAFEADQDERQGDFSFPTYPCLGKYVKKSIFTLRKRNVEKPFVRAAWWFCSNSGVLFRNGLQRHSLPEIFYTVVTVFPSCSSNFTREGCRIARKLRSISIGILFKRHCSLFASGSGLFYTLEIFFSTVYMHTYVYTLPHGRLFTALLVYGCKQLAPLSFPVSSKKEKYSRILAARKASISSIFHVI